MNFTHEQRRAPRLFVTLPTVVEKLGSRVGEVHPVLAAVYERVQPDLSDVGNRFPAVLKDLSVNGCFIEGPPLPLLSRIAFTFAFGQHGQVEALGWVLWRRVKDADLPPPAPGAAAIKIKAGFGVLFEAVPLDMRVAIARMVTERGG
jgi:hypothetical protein